MTQTSMTSTFYDNWLEIWNNNDGEKRRAKGAIYPEQLQWVRTRQDAQVALLLAPETGFRTLGTVSMIAEIPPGWHTGKHSHGEEAMYIVSGSGFSVINNQRFNWEEGSCIRIPFGAEHQHFNTGTNPVKYYSVMAPHLESFCLVGKIEQYEDCGEIRNVPDAKLNSQRPDHDEKGRMIVMHLQDAPVTVGGENVTGAPDTPYSATLPHEMKSGDKQKGHHSKLISFMGSRNDFVGEEIEITHILIDQPGTHTGKHAHMEAILYVLQGEGYTVIDGEKVPWKTGTGLHVQGPQTVHQHFNTGNNESRLLRAHNCVSRKFFQSIAKEKFPYVSFETK